MAMYTRVEVEMLVVDGTWSRRWVEKGSPVDLALGGEEGGRYDDIRKRYRVPQAKVTTLRIPLGPMAVHDQFRRLLTQEDCYELANMGDSMEDRDANIHTTDERQLGVIKNWEVKPNYDMGGRLELVIEIEHVEG